MTNVVIPNRPLPGEERDINALLANFDAITKVINGEIDSGNITAASIKTASYENGSVTEAKLATAVQTKLNEHLSGFTISYGLITATGGTEKNSGDFTVKKVSTGVYEIKWAVPKTSAKYSVIATPLWPEAVAIRVGTQAEEVFFVYTETLVGPLSMISAEFSFIAIS